MELAAIDDGVGDIRAIVREDMGKLHAETQSKMLVMPLERYDDGTATTIERNYTSLMKIVSSAGEIAAIIKVAEFPPKDSCNYWMLKDILSSLNAS